MIQHENLIVANRFYMNSPKSAINLDYLIPKELEHFRNTIQYNFLFPLQGAFDQIQNEFTQRRCDEIIISDIIAEKSLEASLFNGFLESMSNPDLIVFSSMLYNLLIEAKFNVGYSFKHKKFKRSETWRYTIMRYILEELPYRKKNLNVKKHEYFYVDGIQEISIQKYLSKDIIYFTRNKSLHKLKSFKTIYLKGQLSVLDYFKWCSFVFKYRNYNRGKLFLKIGELSLSDSLRVRHYEFFKKSLIFNIEAIAKRGLVLQQLNTYKSLGWDLKVIYSVCQILGIRHINHQIYPVAKKPFLDYDICDVYYMYHSNTRQFFNKFSLIFHSPPALKSSNINSGDRIIVYLQPDIFESKFIEFLKCHLGVLVEERVSLRFHYRNTQSFKESVYSIINNNGISLHDDENPLENCKAAVGFNSSVLYLAKALGLTVYNIASEGQLGFEKDFIRFQAFLDTRDIVESGTEMSDG